MPGKRHNANDSQACLLEEPNASWRTSAQLLRGTASKRRCTLSIEQGCIEKPVIGLAVHERLFGRRRGTEPAKAAR